MMEFQNPRFVSEQRVQIDMTVNHPDFGWIPITIDAVEYPELWEQAVGIAVDPLPVAIPVPSQLTFVQFIIGLVSVGWITEAEGSAWLDGVLPEAMNQLLATMPVADRFAAKARALKSTIIERNDPLVVALAAMQGRAPADVDEFFRQSAQL